MLEMIVLIRREKEFSHRDPGMSLDLAPGDKG